MLSAIGANTISSMSALGRMSVFAWRILRWLISDLFRRPLWSRCMPLFFEVGNRTVPVVIITGTFVGLVLAIQSFDQLRAAGFENRMGAFVSLSLVTELGPVLAGVMVAGRVGGALTAEIGTMRVTEQISALSVMGADPIRHLVLPRFLACFLVTPLLTFSCVLSGSMAGWFIAVVVKGVPSSPYWYYVRDSILTWDMMVGTTKSFTFGGVIGLIACYKGFHCRSGAEGVGRACTESFVVSFMVILITDFFLGTMFNGLYYGIYGFKPLV